MSKKGNKKGSKLEIIKNLKGQIKWYNDKTGKGMISTNVSGVGSLDIPVNKRDTTNKFKSLRPNENVSFDCVSEYNLNNAINVKIIKPYLKLYYGIATGENEIKLEDDEKDTIYYENSYSLGYFGIGERVEFEIIHDDEYDCPVAINIKKAARQPTHFGKIMQLFVAENINETPNDDNTKSDDNKSNNNNNNSNKKKVKPVVDGYGTLKDIDDGTIYEFDAKDVRNLKYIYERDFVIFCIDYSQRYTLATNIRKCKKPEHLECDKSKKFKGRVSLIKGRYGFIKVDGNDIPQDLYFEIDSNKKFKDGDRVLFNVERNTVNDRVYAVNVNINPNINDDNKSSDNNNINNNSRLNNNRMNNRNNRNSNYKNYNNNNRRYNNNNNNFNYNSRRYNNKQYRQKPNQSKNKNKNKNISTINDNNNKIKDNDIKSDINTVQQ